MLLHLRLWSIQHAFLKQEKNPTKQNTTSTPPKEFDDKPHNSVSNINW